MATCFDEPGVIFDTRFCLDAPFQEREAQSSRP